MMMKVKIVKNPTTQYFLKRYEEQDLKFWIDWADTQILMGELHKDDS